MATTPEIRDLVERAVLSRSADAILLSAGLDTSVIAAIAARSGHRPLAVTVAWDEEAPDLPFARELAQRLGLRHEVLITGAAGLLAAVPDVVAILRSFDPMEIRNSTVQYIGLREAARLGARSCYVGDAADELFAGYSYMVAMEPGRLDEYTRELASFMRFAAGPLGQALGVEVVSPYLDADVVAAAVALPPEAKVGEREGVRHGKLPLRVDFEDLLGERHAWRVKTAAEYGSGSTRLGALADERVATALWNRMRSEAEAMGVKLREKEQAFYWPSFVEHFGRPADLDPDRNPRCPECCGPLPDVRSRYCPTCGAYPVG